jgi:hypothetical protein
MQGPQHSQAIRTVRFFPTAEKPSPQPTACGPAPCGVFASIEVGVPPTIFDQAAPQPNLREGRFVVIHSPGSEDRAH